MPLTLEELERLYERATKGEWSATSIGGTTIDDLKFAYALVNAFPDLVKRIRGLERGLEDHEVDIAELQYWRNCNADIMQRKEMTDGLSHADRIAKIRLAVRAALRKLKDRT